MESYRILIAEDEPLTRMMLRARLEKIGHQVVAEAENGVQAVQAARVHEPDLIIMIFACRSWTVLKQRVRLSRSVPVLLCSSQPIVSRSW